MLANTPPPRLPAKRLNPLKRGGGGLMLAAVIVIALTIAAAGGLYGYGPSRAPDTQAVAMEPAGGASFHDAQRSGPNGSGGGGGFAADDTHMFHGYPCTVDCSGHKAGYNWAKDQGITEAARCPIAPANLMSLTEGCWAETGRDGPYAQGR